MSNLDNGKYPIHPFSQLKMLLKINYQNMDHLNSIVKLGPISFDDYCSYKISRIFSLNVLQPSVELEANNFDFCFEDLNKSYCGV